MPPGANQPPPGEAGKPGQPPGKPGEPGKAAEGPKPVQRPTKPETPPNPEELKVRPDAQGKIVKFSFNGQPWLGVLEWLANISNMSLDWQELPGDYLNLTTRQSYTVREVRDLINSRLLPRGYTLLCRGEQLTVADIKKLDPSMVPRVEPKDLAGHDPYEFVKVSFALDWLLADKAVTELKPMLSPNAKINALADVNRIEVMDSVANLREVYALLKSEQSAESQQRLVRKWVLEYARAADVDEQLHTLLGLEKKQAAPAMPQNPQEAQQQAMMMQQQMMQQQQQGGGPGQPGGKPPGGAAGAKGSVTLVANQRENSIVAIAPPDKMATIAQIIEAVDVPTDNSQSLLSNVNRMQVYRLTGVDPEPVVKTLTQIGNLSPNTRLEIDKKNKAIIANGSLADHVIIRAVVDKLSGSERKFDMFPLRKLRADDVAGTIAFMMGVDMKKKKENTNRYYGYFGMPSQSTNEKPNEFRVDADVEHNWLLLWANDVESSEVQNLLVKLGEMPPKGGNPATMRVIDTGDYQEALELLERLRHEGPKRVPNELSLPPFSSPKKQVEEAQKPSPAEESLPSKTTARRPPDAAVHLAQLRHEVNAEQAIGVPKEGAGPSVPTAGQNSAPSEPAKENGTGGKSLPPVTLSVGADGKIVISSEDTQALDLLEELAAQLASRPKNYKIFRLKYASAYGVSLNLQDFFKDDKKEQARMPWYYYDFYGSNQDDSDSNDDKRLSRRPKLKFISDSDSNTILVQGADPTQLKTIDDLITNIYDKPPPTDTETQRKTETIRLRFSKAKAVADTVKDVYRDLLSANDKALINPNQPQGGRGGGFTISYDYGSSSGDKGEQKVPKFKGLLSIGVDETSNSLAVSAPAYLFEPVTKMIRDLDEAAAANSTVRMVKVGQGMSAAHLQDVLDGVLNHGSSRRPSAPAKEGTLRPPAAKPGTKSGAKPAANGGQAAAQPAADGK